MHEESEVLGRIFKFVHVHDLQVHQYSLTLSELVAVIEPRNVHECSRGDQSDDFMEVDRWQYVFNNAGSDMFEIDIPMVPSPAIDARVVTKKDVPQLQADALIRSS